MGIYMTTTTVAPSTATVTDSLRRALTAQDRCDRCGAQAYRGFIVTTTGKASEKYGVEASDEVKDTELLFCAHHARRHEPVLAAMGAVAHIDETDKLDEGNRQQGEDHA